MASAKKKSIYIIGNSHTKMFLGNDTLDFPENATSESDVFKYIIFNVGPSTAYNFFWNPKYYPTLINRLNNNTIEFDYISLLLGEIDCREHVINQYIANKKSMEDNIVEIIDRYMMCVIDLKKRGYKPIVFAVHPPTTALITKGTAKEIIPIIITIMIQYNEILKERTTSKKTL
jgi:hypothetical protein